MRLFSAVSVSCFFQGLLLQPHHFVFMLFFSIYLLEIVCQIGISYTRWYIVCKKIDFQKGA